MVDLDAARIALKAVALDDTLLVVIAQRGGDPGLVRNGIQRNIVILHESRAGHGVRVIESLQTVLGHITRYHAVAVLIIFSPDLLVRASCEFVIYIPLSIKHIKLFGNLLHAEIHIQIDIGLQRGATALGRDDDDAVGAARTVNGGCRSVFQHVDRRDVVGIDRCKRIIGVLSTAGRRGRHLSLIHVNLHAVDDIERRRAGIQRIGTADSNIHAGSSLARLRRDTHAGHAPLQSGSKIC